MRDDYSKDNDFPMLIALGFIFACLLFYGAIKGLKEITKTPPKKTNIDSAQRLREQKQKIQDIEDQRKRLMDDQKQRLKDMQRMQQR
ncbi:MAG TPA: hypothetical protein PLH56_06120 [Candidatus Omnitrophota bacterium]|nr:hypothetical protein [Candidatus Omnitrophota bacterium]